MSGESLIIGNGYFAAKSGKMLGYTVENNNLYKPIEINFFRSTTATYISSSDTIATANAGIFRVQNNSLLLEPQRTNLIINSILNGGSAAPTSFTQPALTGTSAPTSSSYGNDSTAYSQSAAAQRPFLQTQSAIGVNANSTYTFSFYVEQISGSVAYENIATIVSLPAGATTTYYRNGVLVNQTDTAATGRISIVLAVSSSAGSINPRIGLGANSNTTGTIVFSRPQLEAGAYATSYIPTTTTSVTRGADSFSRNNIYSNGLISDIGGTWYVELKNNIAYTRDTAINGMFLSESPAGSQGNSLSFRNTGVANSRLVIQKFIGTTNSDLYTLTTSSTKVAIKWNGSTADVFVNGTKVVSATAFTYTKLQFLAHNVSVDVPKYIQAMALYPIPLSDSQCISLTT